MDRPSRKTKVVNYCENKDFDDDEDFACSKAPPSKKAREETKHEQKKPSVRSSSPTTAQSEKSRKPLDERLHERDLEAAITLSLLNNSEGLNDSPTTDVKAQSPVDENTDPASLLLSNCSVDGAVLGLDEITSEKASPAVRQRKTSTKSAEVQRKEDEDYKPKNTPDSESDEDFSEPEESEDEEFTVKKSSKAKRKEKVSKKDKPKPSPAPRKEKKQSRSSLSKPQAAGVSRSPPAAKLVPSKPASFNVKPVSSVSPAGGRIPKWNPPAQVGKSPTSSQTPAVKSPSAGLRLGLSRMVRVKPLHPSVASH
ncbi:RAD51-associated protein 1 isoform X1 [Gambusia affinis]|uniref:RAD51-associated protein 1 isoform X1 n=1 Tax=Gambusia affinis TaxID=33528 RepID=UPI001CDBBF90|nr:RAD51-associated protein 1 isoform X1 [Gambusia affinis]XP_043963718.1 RAD51-associated protein 1 isoform X1 [Gambusia affinis]